MSIMSSSSSSSSSLRLVALVVLAVSALVPTTNAAPSHLRASRELQQQDTKDTNEQGRIVGGQPARDDQFLFYGRWGGCGCSLIAPDVAISAAHCNPQDTNTIRLGAHSQDGNDGTKVKIRKRVRHPLNEDNGLIHDYLLLFLEEPVFDHPTVDLNTESNVPGPNDRLEVCGLGRLNYKPGDKPSILQYVDVPNHPDNYCKIAYGKYDPEIMLCAGDETYDACIGDSGGPILIPETNKQVGIVSFGDGCAKEGKPGVYSRISGAIDWIYATSCEYSNHVPNSWCDFGGAQTQTEPLNTPAPVTPAPVTPAPVTPRPTPSPTLAPVTPAPVDTTTTTSSTPPPTPTPVGTSVGNSADSGNDCRDAPQPEPVSDMPAILSCDWLAENLVGNNYLCEIYDVAMACMETCGICDMLEMFGRQSHS